MALVRITEKFCLEHLVLSFESVSSKNTGTNPKSRGNDPVVMKIECSKLTALKVK